MNKIILKEFERKHLIFEIIFYCVFVILGFVLLNVGDIGLIDTIKYAPYLFYTLAFFSILAYFINRCKDEYELLLFGFINVVVATFILVYNAYPDSGFILADAVLLYSIANVLNKGYSCKKMIIERDINFFIKVSITVMLLFIGVFVVASIYDKIEAGVLILGYYFIIFGLLSLLEPLNSVVLGDPDLQNRIFDFLAYDQKIANEEPKEIEEKKEVKKKPAVRKTTTKKTTVKKTVAKKAPAKKTTKKVTRKTTKK